MTFRERIANWISGGALLDGKIALNRMRYFAVELDKANDRLDRIAAEETPKANATVRRMAAIARGEW